MSGATLLALQDESDTGSGDGIAHALGFVADDGIDVAGRNYPGGGCDYVRQQGFAAHFMQYFGVLGSQPRSFARGQDRDGYAGVAVLFSFRHLIHYTASSQRGAGGWLLA